MPLHPKFTARVIVASGQVLASNRLQDTVGQKQLNDLVFLTNEILQDDFLSHLIVQIWVDDNQEIHLIPMIAQEDILLGTITDANSKLQNLKSFYTQTNSNQLNNYSLINLKFKNQVVATKRSNTQKTNPIK
jgi:cell division protein FtsQ